MNGVTNDNKDQMSPDRNTARIAWEYAGWSFLALVTGISISSFVVQGVLFASSYLGPGGAWPSRQVASLSETAASADSVNSAAATARNRNEGLGSDDGVIHVAASSSSHEYDVTNATSLPNLSAQGFLVADLESGEIFMEKNGTFVSPMASVSKLMTALVAAEKLDPDKIAIVSQDAYNTFGTEGELSPGEKLRVSDLLYPLLIESSNDAAEVLAETYGRADFLAEMNRKANELGMVNTYYDDPSGLSPKNVSTVEDLLKLGRYIYENTSNIYDITRIKQYSILHHTWVNQNELVKYDSFLGGKNGYIDQSKQTVLSLFDIPLARGGNRSVVIILLRSDNRAADIAKLIPFIEKNAYYTPADQQTP